MRITAIVAIVASVLLSACAGDKATPGLMTKEDRCVIYTRTVNTLKARLENPVYLQDEKQVQMAKRALMDAELAMTIAGCPVP